MIITAENIERDWDRLRDFAESCPGGIVGVGSTLDNPKFLGAYLVGDEARIGWVLKRIPERTFKIG
jgi:hypothetical protein